MSDQQTPEDVVRNIQKSVRHHPEVDSVTATETSQGCRFHVTFKYNDVPTNFQRDYQLHLENAHATNTAATWQRFLGISNWTVEAEFFVPMDHLESRAYPGGDE